MKIKHSVLGSNPVNPFARELAFWSVWWNQALAEEKYWFSNVAWVALTGFNLFTIIGIRKTTNDVRKIVLGKRRLATECNFWAVRLRDSFSSLLTWRGSKTYFSLTSRHLKRGSQSWKRLPPLVGWNDLIWDSYTKIFWRMGVRDCVAQWIAFLLHTPLPQVWFSVFPIFFYVAEIYWRYCLEQWTEAW